MNYYKPIIDMFKENVCFRCSKSLIPIKEEEKRIIQVEHDRLRLWCSKECLETYFE